MSQPVKLSDPLILDARLVGQVAERSIAGQIEYWANLGRAIEPLIQCDAALSLCRAAAATPLSRCLDSVDSPEGRRRLTEHLATSPHPRFEPSPDAPGLLVRIDVDGTRSTGRFVNRRFETVATSSRTKRRPSKARASKRR